MHIRWDWNWKDKLTFKPVGEIEVSIEKLKRASSHVNECVKIENKEKIDITGEHWYSCQWNRIRENESWMQF